MSYFLVLVYIDILGSVCVLVQPDGWARGEREGHGGPYDVTSLSLRLDTS